MSLESTREKTFQRLRTGADATTVLEVATRWFDHYKRWEAGETWDRAFQDNRMTMRVAPEGTSSLSLKDTLGQPCEIMLNATVQGASRCQDPQVFLEKNKFSEGLHDVSAVLLRGTILLSGEKKVATIPQQGFKDNGDCIFMPIPLEEDLKLFHELNAAARQAGPGKLMDFVIQTRARMTRLKYGDPTDMMNGFQVHAVDGRQKPRYGDASHMGNPFEQEVLAQRIRNALAYKTLILPIRGKERNNEVTMKLRHHAGDFPWVGCRPGSPTVSSLIASMAPADGFAIKSLKRSAFVGTLSKEGRFRPVRTIRQC